MTPREFARSKAKILRAELTPAEKAMWRIVHEGELIALNWRRQTPFGRYILDLVSHAACLVVELDGGQHSDAEQILHDEQRTACLVAEGYQVLRISNHEALTNSDGVWRSVHAAACKTPAVARLNKWRAENQLHIAKANAGLASPSMGEAPLVRRSSKSGGGRSGGGGVRAALNDEPNEAHSSLVLASPPQSALRADSSPIEGEPKVCGGEER